MLVGWWVGPLVHVSTPAPCPPLPKQALVRSCLSHDPGDRPTAPQLLDQLTSMLAEEQRGGALNGGLDGGRGGGGMDGNGTVGGSTGEQ